MSSPETIRLYPLSESDYLGLVALTSGTYGMPKVLGKARGNSIDEDQAHRIRAHYCGNHTCADCAHLLSVFKTEEES